MKITLTICFLFISYIGSNAQKPGNGTYKYSVAFAEWRGQSLGSTCTVIIKGDSIKVVHNGRGTLSGRKGDVIDQGVIVKHTKSGKWIIAHHPEDKNAAEVGGCSDGPSVIDFKRKKFWRC